jgi:hypothetical protein
MLSQLLIAWCLLASSVVIHAYGVTSALRWLRRQAIAPGLRSWTWLFVRLAAWIVLLHVVEITVWAFPYVLLRAMPDVQSAVYFSAVTYTTTGYGDLVLPPRWRLIGAVEALTGILMCGWSTGFFFAVLSRMFEADAQPSPTFLSNPSATPRAITGDKGDKGDKGDAE